MIKKILSRKSGQVSYWISDTNHEQTIFFLHGLTADHHLFDKQAEILKDKFNIIVWDMPLHGVSRPYSDFTYSDSVGIINEILVKEDIEALVLVGQSAGGYIAQSFVNTYPEKVKGFVGIGTTPIDGEYYSSFDRFFLRNMVPIVKMYPFNYYCKVSSKSVANTATARESMHRSIKLLGKKDLLLAIKSVYDELLLCNEAMSYDGPVMLTYGENDKTGYVKKYNDDWAKKNDYQVKVIKDASHNANYDNWNEFNQYLIEFMGKIN